jgi:hypothetical protein
MECNQACVQYLRCYSYHTESYSYFPTTLQVPFLSQLPLSVAARTKSTLPTRILKFGVSTVVQFRVTFWVLTHVTWKLVIGVSMENPASIFVADEGVITHTHIPTKWRRVARILKRLRKHCDCNCHYIGHLSLQATLKPEQNRRFATPIKHSVYPLPEYVVKETIIDPERKWVNNNWFWWLFNSPQPDTQQRWLNRRLFNDAKSYE